MSSIASPIQFPPIPLVSGDTVTGEHGESRVRAIEIVVTCEDGREQRLPLSYAFGGWWVTPVAG